MPEVKNGISFTLKNGDVVSYDRDFVLEERQLIKTRVRIDGVGEGPWAWIHPDDREAYDADEAGRTILVVSANDTLAGISGGMIYPARLMGIHRPECVVEDLIPPHEKFGYEAFEHILHTHPICAQARAEERDVYEIAKEARGE
jgi:hypothetical protein